jgi:peptidoglycan/LPS O-acetylase OafA/YrhL
MKRLPALDGLRGTLACVVFLHHAFEHNLLLHYLSQAAVAAFFVISGNVLTRSWDGRFGKFLVRRFLRLWPLFVLCLGAGFLLSRQPVVWTQFFWFPLIGPNDPVQIDPPAWSLCIEAWAMLAMPLFVWAGTGSIIRAELAVFACVLGVLVDPRIFFGVFFILGAWTARFDIRLAALEWSLPQWLGRISYSFYLSHWLVLHYVPGGLPVTGPLSFLIGWLLCETVEKWSIRASRLWRPAPARDAVRPASLAVG